MAESIEQYEERGRKLNPKASKESISQAATMAHFVELTIEATAAGILSGLKKSRARRPKKREM